MWPLLFRLSVEALAAPFVRTCVGGNDGEMTAVGPFDVTHFYGCGVGTRARGRKKISVPGCRACLPSAPLRRAGGEGASHSSGAQPAASARLKGEERWDAIPRDGRSCLLPTSTAPRSPGSGECAGAAGASGASSGVRSTCA